MRVACERKIGALEKLFDKRFEGPLRAETRGRQVLSSEELASGRIAVGPSRSADLETRFGFR